jgi:cytochrome c-type biogenesis protein CcmH/NrfG
MAKKDETPEIGYVKKETVFWVATITLVVGFLIGVVLTVYKSRSGLPVQSSPQGSQSAPPSNSDQGSSVEMAARIIELEKQTAQNPQSAEAWIQLGHLYFDTDNYEKAIGAYQNSLALKPDNANVLTDMGVMYRRSGMPAEAIKAFSKAIAVDPRHEVSRFNKGIVLMHDLKDREGALKAWEGLLEINPLAMAPNGQSVDQLIQHYREHLKK